DAEGTTGDDGDAAGGEIPREIGGAFGAVAAGGAGPDDGDRAPEHGVETGGASDPQSQRCGRSEIVERDRPFLITGNDEAAADACHALEVSSSGRVAGAHRPPLDRLGELTVPDRPGAISRSAGSRSVDRPGPGRLGAGGDEAGDRLLCVGLTGGDGRDDR